MTSNAQKIINVKVSKPYDVIIGSGIIENVGKLVSQVVTTKKLALVTDDTVDGLYSQKVINLLKDSGFEVAKFAFLHGECSKNIDTYSKILQFLAENQFTRTDAIIALGGGVVGDMAGFASATYLRGIKYIQIPTTLLAQIDSSVGGKTAIDLPQGKNLVGAFYQPELVICDTDMLKTLPKEIFQDGMGEAVKYSLLDKRVFDLLLTDYDIVDLVYLCVDYKRMVVEKDEFEGGLRKLLNLGHTPAHGIERLSNYTIPHGNAVAMGLKIILKSSLNHGFIDSDLYQNAIKIVEDNVRQTACPYTIEQICNASLTDKKRSGDYITLIMVHGVGDCRPVKIEISNLWGYLD